MPSHGMPFGAGPMRAGRTLPGVTVPAAAARIFRVAAAGLHKQETWEGWIDPGPGRELTEALSQAVKEEARPGRPVAAAVKACRLPEAAEAVQAA